MQMKINCTRIQVLFNTETHSKLQMGVFLGVVHTLLIVRQNRRRKQWLETDSDCNDLLNWSYHFILWVWYQTVGKNMRNTAAYKLSSYKRAVLFGVIYTLLIVAIPGRGKQWIVTDFQAERRHHLILRSLLQRYLDPLIQNIYITSQTKLTFADMFFFKENSSQPYW